MICATRNRTPDHFGYLKEAGRVQGRPGHYWKAAVRELTALYHRYGGDMKDLAQFMASKSK